MAGKATVLSAAARLLAALPATSIISQPHSNSRQEGRGGSVLPQTCPASLCQRGRGQWGASLGARAVLGPPEPPAAWPWRAGKTIGNGDKAFLLCLQSRFPQGKLEQFSRRWGAGMGCTWGLGVPTGQPPPLPFSSSGQGHSQVALERQGRTGGVTALHQHVNKL